MGNGPVEIAYGQGSLDVALPASATPTIIRKQPVAKIADPAATVRDALTSPIGAAPLDQLAAACRTACILICDITRPVPNHLFLRPMIETLHGAGIPYDAITVLIATGLHRPAPEPEIAEIVGDPWVMQHVRVVNHFARDDAAHIDLGTTVGRQVPVSLDRRFVDADLRIATGLVEPHFMAGWSGGRKVVAPGVAGHKTIRTFHSARFMEDPLAVQCNLTGNPLHEEQLEIVRMVAPVYAFNTVIDDNRDLTFVSFGEIIASHMAAVAFAEKSMKVPLPRRFNTIVTSSAGYPLDKTYYQTVKAMVTPLDILAPGGTLIVASACSEGIGSAEFRAAQQRLIDLGADGFLATLTAKSLADVDEWQTEMQLKPMRLGRIQLYSQGLNDTDQAVTGVEMISDLESAIAASVTRHGDAQVAVIPEGPYVIPVYAQHA